MKHVPCKLFYFFSGGGSRVWSYLNQEFTPGSAGQPACPPPPGQQSLSEDHPTSPVFQPPNINNTQTMFSSTSDYSSMQQSIQVTRTANFLGFLHSRRNHPSKLYFSNVYFRLSMLLLRLPRTTLRPLRLKPFFLGAAAANLGPTL